MCLAARLFDAKRQQCQKPRPFDAHGQLALVAGAVSAQTPRQDLTPVAKEPLKPRGIFIIHDFDLVDAEATDLTFWPAAISAHP